MKRRTFLNRITGTAMAAGGPWAHLAVGAQSPRKPNIVLFFVDDNVVETIRRGGPCPNIRSLGDNGVTFSRAYTPHGVCGPARFAILSGRYMSRCIDEHVAGRRDNGFLLYKLLQLALWHRAYLG